MAFRLAALTLGLALLCGLEGTLRLVGFGSSHPLFIPFPEHPEFLQANPDVVQRYFRRAPALQIATIPFRAHKAPGTLRIVVQGGSSAAGFPYGRWASLAGMLGDRLETTYPERDIEVISTAMAAVNSYTLADFADEIAAIEPDAVLIYAGHNEYLGVLGAGSALTASRSPALTRLQLAMHPLRLLQLSSGLLDVGRATVRGLRASGAEPGQALMAMASTAAPIPQRSPTRARGQRARAAVRLRLHRLDRRAR